MQSADEEVASAWTDSTKGETRMMPGTIEGWAILLAVVSFFSFAVGAISNIVAQHRAASVSDKAANVATQVASQAKPGFVAQANAPTVPELTDLVKALTGAVEAIVKAGPALAGLVASVLFLGIAAWASVHGADTKSSCSITADTSVEIAGGKLKAAVPVKCDPPPPNDAAAVKSQPTSH